MIKAISVFISYRRKDSKANARSLYQALKDDFEVFFDIDKENSISYGQNFPERIEDGIKKSDIFISIIGREFASELNNRKDKYDWVLEEIIFAKKLKKKFLPIFIDEAEMPNKRELPKEVEFICEIDAFTLSHDKFEQDIETVRKAIRKIIYVPKSITVTNISNRELFNQLEVYLKQLKWKNANMETINILLKFSNREKEGWLKEKEIEFLSCDLLLSINQLWYKYSGGYFSFSKQLALMKEYCLSLDNPNDFIKYSERVQWKKNRKWKYEGDAEIIGSYPTPSCFKNTLSTNRSSFQKILKKIQNCQKEYYGEE